MSPPESATDAAIIAASRDRPAEFAIIFDRHGATLHRYLARRLGPATADDVLAETFLVAFSKRATFDTARPSARPWLYGIAANLVADHRRKEARRLQLVMPTEPDAGCHADLVAQRVSAQASQARLHDALDSLENRDREVVLLIAWEELSYAEVAEALNIPVGTVRSRLNRARTKLRAALGGSDPSALSDDTNFRNEAVRHG
jgi:RNA polymerase sigma factor (sigma-70 family)